MIYRSTEETRRNVSSLLVHGALRRRGYAHGWQDIRRVVGGDPTRTGASAGSFRRGPWITHKNERFNLVALEQSCRTIGVRATGMNAVGPMTLEPARLRVDLVKARVVGG